MSSGVVRAAISSFITNSDHLHDLEHYSILKEQIKDFLEAITDAENDGKFDAFASTLIEALEKCLQSGITKDAVCHSKCIKREKLWTAFNQLRFNNIPKIWNDLFAHSNIPSLTPLVYQGVSQRLYSDMIVNYCSTDCTREAAADEDVQLTADKENILRFAAGYIPFKLLKKYEKALESVPESANIVDCLLAMAVNGEESSFLEYTTKWMELVNRGKLFEINDTAYMLFKEIELKLRRHLLAALKRGTCSPFVCSQRETIICSVCSEETVQFFWTIVSVDITSEEQAVKLLNEIVGLWLTVRGFSMTGMWMKQYKEANKGISKQKGLRKELKGTTNQNNNYYNN